MNQYRVQSENKFIQQRVSRKRPPHRQSGGRLSLVEERPSPISVGLGFLCVFLLLWKISWCGERRKEEHGKFMFNFCKVQEEQGQAYLLTFIRYSLWIVCGLTMGMAIMEPLRSIGQDGLFCVINVCLSSVSWTRQVAGLEPNLQVSSFVKIVLMLFPRL